MVDVWPASLPQRLNRDGYSDGMGDGRLRSPMDAGPAKVRRRSSAMPRPLQGRIVMTGAQLATLRLFVQDDLIGGSLPFLFPDPVTRDPVLIRFGGNLPSWVNLAGDLWNVALELEVLP